MKTCSHCGVEKLSEDFYVDNTKATGLSSRCKTCVIEASAAWQRKHAQKRRLYLARYYVEHEEQAKAYGRKRYGAKRDEIAKATSAWRKANPLKANGYSKKYRKANRSKRAALIAKYRAAQSRRTPPRLNQAHLAEIEGVYHFAKVMEIVTGREYHVDHIEPLQGKDVSGLHVPWNLRAIPARENIAKGNRRIATRG